MFRSRVFVAVALFGVVTAAFAQQVSPTAVATTTEVMKGVVVPASTAVFRAAAEAPATDEGWAVLRLQALMLAESGNLLMVGSRARDRGEWLTMSAALRDTAAAAVKALDARNAERFAELSDQVYETCEQCHARYMQRDTP